MFWHDASCRRSVDEGRSRSTLLILGGGLRITRWLTARPLTWRVPRRGNRRTHRRAGARHSRGPWPPPRWLAIPARFARLHHPPTLGLVLRDLQPLLCRFLRNGSSPPEPLSAGRCLLDRHVDRAVLADGSDCECAAVLKRTPLLVASTDVMYQPWTGWTPSSAFLVFICSASSASVRRPMATTSSARDPQAQSH